MIVLSSMTCFCQRKSTWFGWKFFRARKSLTHQSHLLQSHLFFFFVIQECCILKKGCDWYPFLTLIFSDKRHNFFFFFSYKDYFYSAFLLNRLNKWNCWNWAKTHFILVFLLFFCIFFFFSWIPFFPKKAQRCKKLYFLNLCAEAIQTIWKDKKISVSCQFLSLRSIIRERFWSGKTPEEGQRAH